MASGIITKDMVLLWTNPTIATFNAQTVPLDLTNYSAVLIEFAFNTSRSKNTMFVGLKNGLKYAATDFGSIDANNTMWLHQRLFSVSNTGVTFEGNKNKLFTATTAATFADDQMVPSRIYGIKA